MFERYTDRSRRIVALAQEEGRMLNHNYTGTAHLLLGMLREGPTDNDAYPGFKWLADNGVTLEAARAEFEQLDGKGESVPSGHISFTPNAKKVCELGLRVALAKKRSYVEIEHLLTVIVEFKGGCTAQEVLRRLGVNLEELATVLANAPGVSEEPADAADTSEVEDIRDEIEELELLEGMIRVRRRRLRRRLEAMRKSADSADDGEVDAEV